MYEPDLSPNPIRCGFIQIHSGISGILAISWNQGIHPASRGVAAYTPPWGLPKLRIFPSRAPQAREFSLFPPGGSSS